MAEFTSSNVNGHHPEVDAAEISGRIRSKAEAHAIPQPDSVDKFHAESRTDEEVKEQQRLYEANVKRETAAAEETVAELSDRAEKAGRASDRKDGLAAEETDRFAAERKALRHLCRRGPHAMLVYWVVRVVLVLGDVAGASGAILLLGEQPFNAFAQATSVAVSAVVLGVCGAELQYWVAAKARHKPVEDLDDEEQASASFFTGPDTVGTAIKILALVFVAGVAAIVGGIFALREAAEGQDVALAFGCFAFALCLASFLNSYEAACEISDYLAVGHAELKGFEKEAAEARGDPVIARHAGVAAGVASIESRNEAEGAAMGHRLRGEMYRKFELSPEIYGHGTAPNPTKESDAAGGEDQDA
jgi:hypothetical protein